MMWPVAECLHEDTDTVMQMVAGGPQVAAVVCNECGGSQQPDGSWAA